MRIILYLGKGGVGKTTVAAASALRSAQLGYRTLVVSTDIAHSLADSLDKPLTGEPIEVAPNLFAQEINVLDEIRQNWGKMQGYVGNVLRRQGMSKAIAEEMAIIPGMEEIVSLLHINRQAQEGHFDRVIVLEQCLPVDGRRRVRRIEKVRNERRQGQSAAGPHVQVSPFRTSGTPITSA